MAEEGGRREEEQNVSKRHSYMKMKHASNSGHVHVCSTVPKNMCYEQEMTRPRSQAFSTSSFWIIIMQVTKHWRQEGLGRRLGVVQSSPKNPTSLTMGNLVAPSCSFSLVTSSLGPAMREVPVSAIVLHPPAQ